MSILKKINVLLVDDDQAILSLLKDTFSQAYFRVVTSSDGVDATFKLNNEPFDLVITDLRMPKKDGIQLIKHIQQLDAEKRMKHGLNAKPTLIIVISASVMDDYRTEIDLLGNIEVIEKPFSPKDILAKVENLFKSREALQGITPEASTFKAGDCVAKEGDPGKSVYYIKSGAVSIQKKTENGKVVEICTVTTGEMVGEMAFISNGKRTASMIAKLDTEIISIPKEKFEVIINEQPKWFKILFQTLTSRLEETTRLLAEERSKK